MYQFLDTLHSYNRYLLLALIALVLIRSYMGWLGQKPFTRFDNLRSLWLIIFTHFQLLIGLLLYGFFSPQTKAAFADMGAAMKNGWLRYFAVEHILAMLIAVVLIQLGRTFSKKTSDDTQKHRTLAIYTSLALLLIVLSLAPKGLLFANLEAVQGQ